MPRSAAQGHSKPYLGSQPVKQASVFRKVTSVSVICDPGSHSESLSISFSYPYEICGVKAEVMLLVLHTKTM